MRRIAVAISKGGVGKSTTAVNLAAGLARRGASILLVDTDTQGQASSMLGVTAASGLAEVIAGDVPITDALVQARERLWILAGGRALAGVKREIGRREIGGERALAEALLPTENKYDYVIVDTSPGWDALNVNVLFYVDEVLAPVSLDVVGTQAIAEFIRNLAAVQKYNTNLCLKYVLPTFLDGRVRMPAEMLIQLKHHYQEQICNPIRYSIRLAEAPAYGKTIFEHAPGSPGAEDYEKLTERIAHG
jgi:chromosome partitioning protein